VARLAGLPEEAIHIAQKILDRGIEESFLTSEILVIKPISCIFFTIITVSRPK